jgi:hypothetical protein
MQMVLRGSLRLTSLNIQPSLLFPLDFFFAPQACVYLCPKSVGLCSVRYDCTEWSMRRDLDGLAAASREALMAEWREVVGRPPPKGAVRQKVLSIRNE